jgi:predicted RND superfamily exporter protein
MTYTITSSLQNSQWNSLILTLIVSLIVLTSVFWYRERSLFLGTITTLPVVIALLWSMGVMYLIGMNFDMMTVTITALTIGLGITYSIHLSHRFVEELETKEPEDAIKSTVMNTGSAIFGAAATTMGGFGVLMLSSMPPMQDFGIIATLSILLSFLLSVFVLPTFLVMWARKKKEKEVSE